MRRRTWTTRLAAAAILALAATDAVAQARPQSFAMTCRQAIGLVRARGPVVIETGGPTGFDTYVRHPRQCDPSELAERSFIPTRDTPACLVGYRCLNEYDFY